MTILVGVRCTDGVVIGADSISTSTIGTSPLVHLQANEKIQILGNVIVAATGAVGFAQRLVQQVDIAIKGNVFRNFDKFTCPANISSRLIKDFQNSMVSLHPQSGFGFGAIMAAALKGEPCLVEFGTSDFQPELKEGNVFFVSLGSGQFLADPFLAFVKRVLWKDRMPTVEQARFGVYWVLDHTIKLAPGGVGGPIKLASLIKKDDNWVVEEMQDMQEAAQYINELESHIGDFALSKINDAESVAPPPAPTE
jgi:predicted proteasome-type protease